MEILAAIDRTFSAASRDTRGGCTEITYLTYLSASVAKATFKPKFAPCGKRKRRISAA
jgi:hypothetical protein